MDPSLYKFIHYIGIFFLLSGLGGYLFSENGTNKLAGTSHGIGLLLILLGGFGMAKHEAIGFSSWFLVKVVIWLVLGAMIVVAKRKLMPPVAAWLFVVILMSIAAYLGFANSVILRF